MCVNVELLERVEEFFDLIVVADEDVELVAEMESLRQFLERDIDGWTKLPSEELAAGVLSRLENVWEFLSNEAQRHNDLPEHFEEIMSELEAINSPGDEDYSYESDLGDDDDEDFESYNEFDEEEDDEWD